MFFCDLDQQEGVTELGGSVGHVGARRIAGSWRLSEALVGSGTKLRMCGIWEGAARRLRLQFP